MAADGADAPLIVTVVGTRPEAIKMAPVVRALSERGVRQEVILTGQHAGLESSFELPRRAVFSLGINLNDQSAGEIREVIHLALLRRFVSRKPGMVLVQGGTSSALGAALAAYDCAVPIGHIEAGLRSGDRRQPWPEEDNRVLIDRMADLLFAPTPSAATNLARERDARGRIFVTGNTGIDALLLVRPAQRQPAENSCNTILVTCHRRENQGARLPAVAAALKRIAAELPVEILFVLHSNPRLRRTVQRLLGGAPNVALIEPLGHSEMVGLMDRSWLILTDSGGIQEEAPYLGLPVLVLRDRTERVEALAAGNAELVGTRSENIYKAVARLLQDESLYGTRARPRFPFGDGHAAPRIARAVEAYFGGATRSPELGRCAEQPGTFS